jgi:hypothetical protein
MNFIPQVSSSSLVPQPAIVASMGTSNRWLRARQGLVAIDVALARSNVDVLHVVRGAASSAKLAKLAKPTRPGCPCRTR